MPELGKWWADIEKEMNQPFKKDVDSYQTMIDKAGDNHELNLDDDISISCFCGD